MLLEVRFVGANLVFALVLLEVRDERFEQFLSGNDPRKAAGDATNQAAPADEIPSLHECEIVERARRGDLEALGDLRRLLDRRPDVVKHIGDLHQHVVLALIGRAGGKDQLDRTPPPRAPKPPAGRGHLKLV